MAYITLISSQTLASAVASVTFSSIPSTYNDLKLVVSTRLTYAGYLQSVFMTINGGAQGTVLGETWIVVDPYSGGNMNSQRYTSVSTAYPFYSSGASTTTNTFGVGEIYIPNYSASIVKQIGSYGVSENNGTGSGLNRIDFSGISFNSATPISSISIGAGANNLDINSSFYLYGIKNS